MRPVLLLSGEPSVCEKGYGGSRPIATGQAGSDVRTSWIEPKTKISIFLSMHYESTKTTMKTIDPVQPYAQSGQSGLVSYAPLRRSLVRHFFETRVECGFCIEADGFTDLNNRCIRLDE